MQKHNLYAEGGEERIRYGLGLSYGNTQGVMKGSDRQTISGNIDLVYRTGKFQFSNKFILDYMKTNNPAVPFSEYAKANPYFRKYNSEGGIDKYLYYTEDPEEYSVPNPLWNAHLNNYDVQDQFGFTNNFILEWFATNDLRARAKFGISKNSSTAEVRLSPQHSDFDEMSETEKGLYTNAQTKNLNYEGDISVTYGHLFAGKHMINAVAGFNFNTKENSKNGYKAIGFTEDEFDSILAMKKGQGILISNQDNVMINVMASEKEDRLITTDASKLRGYYGDSKQIEREQQRRIAG